MALRLFGGDTPTTVLFLLCGRGWYCSCFSSDKSLIIPSCSNSLLLGFCWSLVFVAEFGAIRTQSKEEVGATRGPAIRPGGGGGSVYGVHCWPSLAAQFRQ